MLHDGRARSGFGGLGFAIKLALDCRNAGFDFFEGKRHLFVIDAKAQAFGTGAMLGLLAEPSLLR